MQNAKQAYLFDNIPIRVVSKRKEQGALQAAVDETVIDIDRTHPVLGNQHILRNHLNDQERAQVIAAHKRDFDHDVARHGPMSQAIDAIVARIKRGERIALRCWCAPRQCHGETYVSAIHARLKGEGRAGERTLDLR